VHVDARPVLIAATAITSCGKRYPGGGFDATDFDLSLEESPRA
jgi:hypothetical protein